MYIIDTDVSIDYMRGDEKIIRILDSLSDMHLTTVSAAELFFGVHSLNSPKLWDSLKNFLQKFDCLPFQFWDAIAFGKIKAELKRKGTLIDDADIIIGATALSYDFMLITRNVKDFKRISGLKMLQL